MSGVRTSQGNASNATRASPDKNSDPQTTSVPPEVRAQASARPNAASSDEHDSASAKPAMSMRSATSPGSRDRAFWIGTAQPRVASALMMRRCASTSLSPQKPAMRPTGSFTAINTLGVLYIVENGENISEVSDLKGKTIYSTGQGTTPEYTLRYLLTEAGIDPDKDVDIQYKSEAPEVLAAMTQDEASVAMLPQPYVTVALNSNENYSIALDVTKEWEKLAADSSVVTGVLVARKSFIEKNKTAFDEFIKEYKASTEYANTNVEETAALLEKYDIFKATIAKKAIPFCNVTFINGEEMKNKAYAYLKVIFDQNPNAVGGKLEEGMFYID